MSSEQISLVQQNRGAEYDRCVFFGVDAAFFPYALFTANQIAERNPARDFDICIATSEPVERHELMDRLGIRIVQIDLGALQSSVRTSEYVTLAGYLRASFPELMKSDYRRALYLDADIYYAHGDLSRLLDLDLGGYALGAVVDDVQLRKPQRIPPDFQLAGLGHARFFNSGVLLIDMARFAAENVPQRMRELADAYRGRLSHHDQSLLNIIFHSRFAELSLRWNFQFNNRNIFLLALLDANLIHFTYDTKPWKRMKKGITPKRFTSEYRAFLAKWFPDRVSDVPDGLELDRQGGYVRFSALLNLVNANRNFPTIEEHYDQWKVHLPGERGKA